MKNVWLVLKRRPVFGNPRNVKFISSTSLSEPAKGGVSIPPPNERSANRQAWLALNSTIECTRCCSSEVMAFKYAGAEPAGMTTVDSASLALITAIERKWCSSPEVRRQTWRSRRCRTCWTNQRT
ncbi:uncharacterized protein LOC119765160 isoform X1 [Culex quinquefasciatus]|uniref:uncharacterized protein LOC119765160 isoform X1 n=1 Tax=Culex quinquefasciatus TaxID=7176 RepID=UPI0018E3F6F6|nr:uncharacterized protein LOC119765160 isoform X1 [Culex quinquefasciatus]XP_038104416.1 uncharacterized protein LOC119765160 isoform X1 [Culex quinquefasciatus]XP_038104417.1 uncharacterized protein LOC119765160 isoform X1 [Culex quinquefasciatus]XP_038104418.1 uncharacterized protein LOC119765160 isoform X1 [Culex quinquefasciatus]